MSEFSKALDIACEMHADTGLLSQAVGGARTVIDGDHSLGDLVSRWRRTVRWTTDATWTAIHHTDHTEGPLS